MQMLTIKKAFTLIELIVGILIVSIICTISFIAYINYSTNARDAKRLSDVNELLTKINLEYNLGKRYSELIITEKTNDIIVNKQPKKSYQGIVDFVALGENENYFKDPKTGEDYPVAYSVGTTGAGNYNFVQMATISEKNNSAVLLGQYRRYTNEDSPSLLTNYVNVPVENEKPTLPYNPGNSSICIGPLVAANAIISNTVGLSGNTEFQNDDPNGLCYYKCKIGWGGENCGEKQGRYASCSGTLPNSNVSYISNDQFFQSYDSESGNYIPATMEWKETSLAGMQIECTFSCHGDYEWNDLLKICEPKDVFAECTGKPENSIWNTATRVAQTWNGSAYVPSNVGVYSEIASSTTCVFKCIENYVFNEDTQLCEIGAREFICAPKPETGTEWNSVSKYDQTWNGSIWSPSDTVTEYNETPSSTSCRYICASGYLWNGNGCISNNRSQNCAALGTGEVRSQTNVAGTRTITQTTSDGINWSPVITKSYSIETTANYCYFKCTTGYAWNGTSCIVDNRTQNCSALGTGEVRSQTNAAGTRTITQKTTDGTNWLPSLTKSYNTSTTADYCYFKCTTGYAWNGASCIVDNRTQNCSALGTGEVRSQTNATGTKTITQKTTDGTNWLPSSAKSYNASTTADYCYFKCTTGYTWNGSSCISNTRTGTCTGIPNTTAYARYSAAIPQTSTDGINWTPSLSGSYSLNPVSGQCRYTCASGYVRDNVSNTCKAYTATTGHTYMFTTAGATGITGPTQTQINTAYPSGNSLYGKVTSFAGIQKFVVETTGTYRIEAFGARGGYIYTAGTGTRSGGYGAMVAGDVQLTAGDILYILVGQAGQIKAYNDRGGGGGGGTYVVKYNASSSDTLVTTGLSTKVTLLFAAGGGGGSGDNGVEHNGGNASSLTTGTGIGGTAAGPNTGGGGYKGSSTGGNRTAKSFLEGGTTTGQYAGFGGGGSSYDGGGGGGGYTGGNAPSNNAQALGGDSYIISSATNIERLDLVNYADGKVNIKSLNSSSYTFTNAGAFGAYGPTQTQINAAYPSGNSLYGKVTVYEGIQKFVVPTTGTYEINAYGARGGYISTDGTGTRTGGYGAKVGGRVTLSAGEILYILVGQAGIVKPYSDRGGPGGGGTFVAKYNASSSDTLVTTGLNTKVTLLFAAGGGGGSGDNGVAYNGGNAYSTTSGTGLGGTCTTSPTSGAGYKGNGASNSTTGMPTSFLTGGIGCIKYGQATISISANRGGFGGGGCPYNGGGGGGGYTGGNAVDSGQATGGYSYIISTATSQTRTNAANYDDGRVEIKLVN